MTKAFSILHRAAALLVALCLLVGMALPVYAAEDEALFFDAGSETIPTIPAADTSSEGVEPAQEPIVTDSETVPDKENTPPAANEPETETETTAQNTETVPNNDGKTQEAAENQTSAADTDTVPADPALTNKTPADTSDTAAAPNHAINAEETTAAKTNTEQDVLFADGDNPNEEDTMLADDSPDNDDANTPDTIADTSVSTGFIPATTTIYFAVDKNVFQDSYRVHLYAHKLDDSGLDKDMVDTGKTTTDGRKIYSVTLNQADYSAGGFYRLIFQYFDGTVFKINSLPLAEKTTMAMVIIKRKQPLTKLPGKCLTVITALTEAMHLTPPNGRAWSTITRTRRFTSKMKAALRLPT